MVRFAAAIASSGVSELASFTWVATMLAILMTRKAAFATKAFPVSLVLSLFTDKTSPYYFFIILDISLKGRPLGTSRRANARAIRRIMDARRKEVSRPFTSQNECDSEILNWTS